jgi:hypothetical protein
MFVSNPLNAQSEPQVTHSEESQRALIQTSINMYMAISYFVDKAKGKGKEERAIKEECQKFISEMIKQLNNESK